MIWPGKLRIHFCSPCSAGWHSTSVTGVPSADPKAVRHLLLSGMIPVPMPVIAPASHFHCWKKAPMHGSATIGVWSSVSPNSGWRHCPERLMMVKACAFDDPRNGTASTLQSRKKREVFGMIISSWLGVKLHGLFRHGALLFPTRPSRLYRAPIDIFLNLPPPA